MQKEKILITGIAGFIGFHLAKKLNRQGHTVFGIDHFNSYYPVKWKFLRRDLLLQLGVETFYCDLTDQSQLHALIEKHKPTKIVHLAAQAGVRYSLENPNSYIQSNIIGFFHLLECIKEKKIPTVYASSSSVYGRNQSVPFQESDPTDHPTSLYAATKKSNEIFADAYHFLHQIPLIGLRFFTVIGPYGRPDMAYFSFAEKMLKNQSITLYQEGLLQRDFTDIEDITDGIIQALQFPVSSGLFNLGHHHPHTTLQLVESLERHLNRRAILKFEETPKTDVPITYAGLKQAQSILGYQPKISFEAAIETFSKWFLSISS